METDEGTQKTAVDVEAPAGGTYGGVSAAGAENPSVPPSYQDATSNNAPPPSYTSLYGELKDAKKNSSGVGAFLLSFFAIILGTVGITILVAMSLAIPIAMIVIGAIYKDDCPLEPYIPIYLIVGGSVGILSLLLDLCRRGKSRMDSDSEGDGDDDNKKKKGAFGSLISCFMLAWFIAGNVWVYKNFYPNSNENSPEYCDHTLYYFAFWLLNSTYILMGLCCCCVCCVACLFGAGSD